MIQAPAGPGGAADSQRGGRCLITGATGFIGGHVAQRLAREGRQVRCLARATSDTSTLADAGVEIVVGDLRSPGSLADAVEGCRSVVHCAALVSDWATTREITQINVGGTQSLLAAAVAASVQRLIHFSTTDVYGRRDGGAIDESHVPARASNWYARTKLAAETEVHRAERAHGLEAVILRPATVYGPRCTDLVGAIARALANGSMLLVDGGRAVAGLCYVDNLVDAVVLALSHEAAPGNAFNVTDGLEVTWSDFTADLARGLGCSPARWSLPYPMAYGLGFTLEHAYRGLRTITRLRTPALLSRQAVHVLGADQRFSNRRLRDLLGWEPRTGYDAGLEATLEWLRMR